MATISTPKSTPHEVPSAPETAERTVTMGAEWHGAPGSEHFVQFYATDDFLVDTVGEYVRTGFRAGHACVIVATPAHRELLESRLETGGLDLAGAQARGEYFALDAAATLAQFMIDGTPEPERFATVVGGIIARAAQGGRHVSVFGEMVALLWAEGNQTAAIRLEELWHDLSRTSPSFSLCCAYPMGGFAGDVYGAPFAEICRWHGRVIPDESYTTLTSPDDRLRAITLLQQKARSLEAEIAERKIVEERLRASESRYRRLFEASTDGILMLDPKTYAVADANPIMEHLLGYCRDQLLGQTLWDTGVFPDRQAAQETLRALRQHRVVRHESLAVRTRDEQQRYVEFVGNQFQVDGHDVIQCNLRDVTEQRRLERRTREALEALLAMARTLVLPARASEGEQEEEAAGTAHRLATLARDVLGCARVAIVAYDDATDQQQPLAVVGLTAEQEAHWHQTLSGTHLSEYLEPALLVALRSGESFTLDVTPARRQEASYGGTVALINPLRVGDQLVGTLALDFGPVPHSYTAEERSLANAVAQLAALTIERDRLLREREAARANELALREANRRMNQFLGIASHELKTPVTAIKLNLQLAGRQLNGRHAQDPHGDELTQAVAQVRNVLARSERGVGRLMRLVDDLIDVSRIQAGKLEMHLESSDLASIARDCVAEQRQLNPGRTISLTLPESGPIVIMADADRLGQVVTNYLTNALKYSPEEAPVQVCLQVAEGIARFAVRDEGPGLPPGEHEHIWDMFHRAPGIEIQSGSGVGLGLGLHISRTIVERHGGEVGVVSAPGQGSTFWFTLPVVRDR